MRTTVRFNVTPKWRARWRQVAELIPATEVLVPIIASGCQAATIALTWNLWNTREFPPNLPVFHSLAGFDYAAPLLAAAVACIFIPRVATPIFVALLTASMLGDQTRIQPEVVSLTLLMALPLLGTDGLRISRWHMTALWFWSGLNKALSSGWAVKGGAAAFIATSLHVPGARLLVALALPAFEIALGVTSVFPRWWRLTRWGAVAVHIGILATLSLFAGYNSAVWPWNVALAAAGFLLFNPKEVPQGRPAPWVTAGAAVLLVTPALFYMGITDAYLSHNLYTSNTAQGQICRGNGLCTFPVNQTLSALNVPLPPELRLFREYFNATCEPDMHLELTGRATIFTDPPDTFTYRCVRRPSE
jgi:hypothetical protein